MWGHGDRSLVPQWNLLIYVLQRRLFFWECVVILVLPLTIFRLVSGTLDHSCVTVFTLLAGFGHARSLLHTRCRHFEPVSRSQDPLAYSFALFKTYFVFARISHTNNYFLMPTNIKSVCSSMYSSRVYILWSAQRRKPHICPWTKMLWAIILICFSVRSSSLF
jgi:hypothetical protein